MKSRTVTAERVRELFNYDSETGVFTRRIKAGKSTMVGEVVGSPAVNKYLRLTVDGVRILAHRGAWLYVNGEHPEFDIDHIDGNRQNNAIGNLRKATRSENMQNEVRGRRNGKSGLLGVSWHKGAQKWMSHIRIPGGGGHKYLGLFEDKHEAHAAYVAAKREMHPFSSL